LDDQTRNSSVDEIGERYGEIPITAVEPGHRCKTLSTLYSNSRNVRLSHQQIETFTAHYDFFIIAPYKYSYVYLLTDQFLVDNYPKTF